MKSKIINSFIFLTLLVDSLIIINIMAPVPAKAQTAPPLLFDSSNHYLGACQLTDQASFTLDKDLQVALFQLWYNWEAGETTLTFTATKDGTEFLSGELKRTNCDTYQSNWCNSDLEVNKVFPKGSYLVTISKARMCLVPGGTGTVRLYGQVASETIGDQQPQKTAPAVNDQLAACSQGGVSYPVFVITIIIVMAITFVVVKLFFK